MRRLVLRSAIGAVFVGVTLSAQTPATPDYSGTWRLVTTGPGASETLRVTQTPTGIMLVASSEGDSAVYELGRVVIKPILHPGTQWTTAASWDGLKLRMTDVVWWQGAMGNVNERVLSLAPSGHLMIELTRRPAKGEPTSTHTEWAPQ